MRLNSIDLDQVLESHLKASQVILGVPSEEGERFVPLPPRQLVGDREIPFDLFLKVKTREHQKVQFVRCCAKGQVFQARWQRKLQELQIPWVFFHPEDEPAVLDYLNAHLEKALVSDGLTYKEKAYLVYDVTLVWLRHFFTFEQARTGPRLQLALRYLDELCALINAEQTPNSFVMDLWQHDRSLYAHSLNTCLLGLAFTAYLKWRAGDIRDFGLGALLHDIGMTKVPPQLVSKPSKLTEAEMDLIKRHPTVGFHLLKNYAVLRWEVLLMVVQHHEHGDGSGYPEGLKLAKIHPWARILSILDSYEALTEERPWRHAYPPSEALWVMRTEWEKSRFFDQTYLKHFIRFLAAL